MKHVTRSAITALAALSAAFSTAQANALEGPSISGQLEYDGILYREPSPSEDYVNQFTLDLEASQALGEDSRVFLNYRLREDVESEERDLNRLREAYLDHRFENFDIRIGRQIFAWGRADVINPTDNFSPTNLVDLLDDDEEKLGITAASVRYYGDDWNLEAVFAPVFQRSYLAPSGSRWFLPLPERIEVPGIPTRFRTQYAFQPVDEPSNGLRDAQWGFRWSGSRPGWDYSLSYFDGWNDLPNFDLSVTPIAADRVQVDVQPEIQRIRVLGADFSTVAGDYTLRGELAYVHTKDPEGDDPAVDDPYVHYVIGFDRTFSNAIGGKDLFVLLEWSHQIPTTGIEYDNYNLDHVFRQTLFARANVEINNAWTVELNAAYDVDQQGALLAPSVIWNPVDDLTVEASLELPLGPSDSFFGGFKDNQSFRLRVQKGFSLR